MKKIHEVSDIIEVVNEIEHKFPVNEWRIEGIHLWPMLRFRIVNLLNSTITGFVYGKNRNDFFSVLKKIKKRVHKKIGLLNSSVITYPSPPEKSDVVFLSYPHSWLELDAQTNYDRYIDPLREMYIAESYTPFVINLCPYSTKNMRNYPPHTHAYMNVNALRERMRIQEPNCIIKREDEYRSLCALLISEYQIVLPPYKSMWAFLVAMKNVYCEIFKRVSPGIGITALYSNMEGLAFNLACKEYGVVSMDVQHGVQARFNAAYANWRDVPPGGYELLPNKFLVWSRKEAAIINEWAYDTKMHEATVIGNPWLDKWRNNNDDIVLFYTKKINKLKQRYKPQSIHILYTLQNNTPPQFVMDAMKAAPKHYVWWLRLHPRFLNQRENIQAYLNRNSIYQYLINEPSTFPLPALLKTMDVHITEHSTVTEDAARFGMPTVNWSEIAYEMYPEEIKTGIAIVSEKNGFDILKQINSQLKYKHTEKKSIENVLENRTKILFKG